MEPPVATCRRTIVTGTVCGLPATTGDCGRHNRPADTPPPPPAVAAACATVAQGPTGWSQQLTALTSSPHTTATEVARWWASLPAEHQREAVSGRYEQVGNLDGIPLDVRDAANRLAMTKWFGGGVLQTPTEPLRLAHYQIAKYVVASEGNSDLVRRSKLHTFAPGSGKVAYLLTADTDATPSHVAVMVPGANSDIVGYPDQYRRAVAFDERVRQQCSEYAADGGTLMWLGYRPPKGRFGLVWALRQVYAKGGSKELAATVDGLRAAGVEQVTAVGHSYGARVALEAVARADADVDQVVLVAPPGEGPAGTIAQVVERTGRDVHAVMYRRDFLSRKGTGPKARAITAAIRLRHGNEVVDGPGVRVHRWEQPAEPPSDQDGKGWPHSAYFADPAAAEALADAITGKHNTTILR